MCGNKFYVRFDAKVGRFKRWRSLAFLWALLVLSKDFLWIALLHLILSLASVSVWKCIHASKFKAFFLGLSANFSSRFRCYIERLFT